MQLIQTTLVRRQIFNLINDEAMTTPTNKKQGKLKSEGGFTLIEIIVAVAIVGFLASIIFASTKEARIRSRDARRREDLIQIRTALNIYYDRFGNWIETASGCGWNGDGAGWFNVGTGSYPKAMSKCLSDAGIIPSEIKDPTGGTTSNPTAGYSYMKYHCGSGNQKQVYVFAKLESLPQSATATDGTCCSTCDTSYGMNYFLKVQ